MKIKTPISKTSHEMFSLPCSIEQNQEDVIWLEMTHEDFDLFYETVKKSNFIAVQIKLCKR